MKSSSPSPMYADAHADLFYQVAVHGGDPVSGVGAGQITVDGMRRANQRLQVCSIWVPPRYTGQAATELADTMLDAFDAYVRAWPQHFFAIQHAHQIARLVAQPKGPVGILPWLEGASPLRGELALLDHFVRRGVKGIGLTWNGPNEVADGCGVPEPRRGLSAFGHDLIDAMQAQRVIVDLAHLPEPAFWQVIERSRCPVVVTHCGLRAIRPMTRNLSNAMARAVAESGGFVGIDFYPGHLDPQHGLPCARRTTLEVVVKNIRLAVNLCGEDNVVLGGDLDGIETTVEGLERTGDVPNLAQALRDAAFSPRQVAKLMGENLVSRLAELW